MVNLSVTSSVMIEDGPALSLSSEIDAESYVAATVTLEPATDRTMSLLPQEGEPVLLAVRAAGVSGPAVVRILPNPPASETAQGASRPADGTSQEVSEDGWITFKGALLISGVDVLKGLGTPRSLRVENTGTEPAKVDVLICLDLP